MITTTTHALFCSIFVCIIGAASCANAKNTQLPQGCERAATSKVEALTDAPTAQPFPPVQVQVRTPVEPTVLPGTGRNYLFYELHIQNFSAEPVTLNGIEVFDADHAVGARLAELKDQQLDAQLRRVTIGAQPDQIRHLGVGQGTVAFVCLAFDSKDRVPGQLRHRLLLDKSTLDGPTISTHGTSLQVLGRPLVGSEWTPANNPSLDSHHRMGLWVVNGTAQISRRYAIDWKKFDSQGRSYLGDARDVHAYFAYGQKVLSVADGTVIDARDGFPDNVPKTEAGFDTALPITLETVGGNQVTIALPSGQYAAYFHLQPGSVRVKAGDKVRRGQLIARIGNSGDARWPHLHFQVTDKADVMGSEGLPYLFDNYGIKTAGQQWERRTAEYPMGDVLVDFGPDRASD
jgi:hypothetical protein